MKREQPRKREEEEAESVYALAEKRLEEDSRGIGVKSMLVCDGKRPCCIQLVWRVL